MRQKLAICCAYLHDPQAILFDEPLTGLDPQGIRVFKRSLQERAAQGAAVVISSHMLAMVEDLCTHVLILDRGVQRFFGPIDELRTSFDHVDAAASLEDIFFAATSLMTTHVFHPATVQLLAAAKPRPPPSHVATVLPAAAAGPLGDCLCAGRRLARQRGHDDLAPRNGLAGNAACAVVVGTGALRRLAFRESGLLPPRKPV